MADRGTDSRAELGLADAFSIANAVCGFFAVALLARGDLGNAGLEANDVLAAGGLLIAGALFDILDGPVARWRGSSAIGETLDTLSDVVTFAMAPAVLLAVAGVAEGGAHPRVLLTAAAAYLVAVLVRLARFAVADSAEDRRSFSGMPCPLATVAVFALVLLDPGAYGVAAGVGLTVWLMLSSVPYPKASRATAPLIAIWALGGAAALVGLLPLDLAAAITVAVVLVIPVVMAARGGQDADVPPPGMSFADRWARVLRTSRWLLPAFVLTYTVARFVVVAGQMERYQINIWVFAILDIGTAWPYGRALVSLLEAIGNRPARTVLAIGTWSALLAVTPYAYLLFASRGMPESLVAAICLFAVLSAAFGLWFTRRQQVPSRRPA